MDELVKQAVRRAIATAAKAGQITYEELNALLPPMDFTSEQIEEVLVHLSDQGIHVVDG